MRGPNFLYRTRRKTLISEPSDRSFDTVNGCQIFALSWCIHFRSAECVSTIYIYKIYKYIGTPRAGATPAFIPDFENAVRTDYAVITIPPLVVVIAARYVHHYYHDLLYSLSSNFIHIINRLLSPSILNSYVPPAPIHIKRHTVLSFCINFLHK